MNCRKCKKPIDNDSMFCKYCAIPQREKCLECGEMELIGRQVCERKLAEASSAMKTFLKTKVGQWRVYFYTVIFFFLITALMIYFATYYRDYFLNPSVFSVICTITFALIGSIISVLAGENWQERKKTEIMKQFITENPKYAEILKKEEECK